MQRLDYNKLVPHIGTNLVIEDMFDETLALVRIIFIPSETIKDLATINKDIIAKVTVNSVRTKLFFLLRSISKTRSSMPSYIESSSSILS